MGLCETEKKPQGTPFIAILKDCAKLKDLHRGERVHADILKSGLLQTDAYVASSLVSMYAKCGAVAKAYGVLDELSHHSVITWNALIAAYAQQHHGKEALDCYDQMCREGIFPDAVTFSCALKACGAIGSADIGKYLHGQIARQGLLSKDAILGTALLDMYAKCGALTKAREVLDELPVRDNFSWSALIARFSQQGQGKEALNCFFQMQNEGFAPDRVVFLCTLKACGSIGAHDEGKKLHDAIVSHGFFGKDIVLGNTLIDMYAKCGVLKKAQQVFDELPVRDEISWGALILGYAEQGQSEEAMICFDRMQQDGLSPNTVSFIGILKACGCMALVHKGKEIHDEIVSQGLLSKDIVLGNALVDMYARCGMLTQAQQVLEELPARDVITWSALIAGFTDEGHGKEVLYCFERMEYEGVHPDMLTFTNVLYACRHLCLVDEGIMYFASMNKKYGMTPTVEHYTCLIDLYGHAGDFVKAITMIRKIQTNDDPLLWSTFLSACLAWENTTLGRWAFEHAVQLDRSCLGAYIFMARLYVSAGMKEEARRIEAMRMKIALINREGVACD